MNTDEMKTCEICGGNLFVDWWDPDIVKCDTCGWTSETDLGSETNSQGAAHGDKRN